MGRSDMESGLVQRSLLDDAFCQMLLEDPGAALEEELGTHFLEEVRIVAVGGTTDTNYLVLPFRSTEAPDYNARQESY